MTNQTTRPISILCVDGPENVLGHAKCVISLFAELVSDSAVRGLGLDRDATEGLAFLLMDLRQSIEYADECADEFAEPETEQFDETDYSEDSELFFRELRDEVKQTETLISGRVERLKSEGRGDSAEVANLRDLLGYVAEASSLLSIEEELRNRGYNPSRSN